MVYVDIRRCRSVRVPGAFDLKDFQNSSHTLAYNQKAHRVYEKSQHAEDFGHIKIFCSFNSHERVTEACVGRIKNLKVLVFVCVASQTR